MSMSESYTSSLHSSRSSSPTASPFQRTRSRRPGSDPDETPFYLRVLLHLQMQRDGGDTPEADFDSMAASDPHEGWESTDHRHDPQASSSEGMRSSPYPSTPPLISLADSASLPHPQLADLSHTLPAVPSPTPAGLASPLAIPPSHPLSRRASPRPYTDTPMQTQTASRSSTPLTPSSDSPHVHPYAAAGTSTPLQTTSFLDMYTPVTSPGPAPPRRAPMTPVAPVPPAPPASNDNDASFIPDIARSALPPTPAEAPRPARPIPPQTPMTGTGIADASSPTTRTYTRGTARRLRAQGTPGGAGLDVADEIAQEDGRPGLGWGTRPALPTMTSYQGSAAATRGATQGEAEMDAEANGAGLYTTVSRLGAGLYDPPSPAASPGMTRGPAMGITSCVYVGPSAQPTSIAGRLKQRVWAVFSPTRARSSSIITATQNEFRPGRQVGDYLPGRKDSSGNEGEGGKGDLGRLISRGVQSALNLVVSARTGSEESCPSDTGMGRGVAVRPQNARRCTSLSLPGAFASMGYAPGFDDSAGGGTGAAPGGGIGQDRPKRSGIPPPRTEDPSVALDKHDEYQIGRRRAIMTRPSTSGSTYTSAAAWGGSKPGLEVTASASASSCISSTSGSGEKGGKSSHSSRPSDGSDGDALGHTPDSPIKAGGPTLADTPLPPRGNIFGSRAPDRQWIGEGPFPGAGPVPIEFRHATPEQIVQLQEGSRAGGASGSSSAQGSGAYSKGDMSAPHPAPARAKAPKRPSTALSFLSFGSGSMTLIGSPTRAGARPSTSSGAGRALPGNSFSSTPALVPSNGTMSGAGNTATGPTTRAAQDPRVEDGHGHSHGEIRTILPLGHRMGELMVFRGRAPVPTAAQVGASTSAQQQGLGPAGPSAWAGQRASAMPRAGASADMGAGAGELERRVEEWDKPQNAPDRFNAEKYKHGARRAVPGEYE